MTLPPVPLDDIALSQLEHALGASLTFDAEDGSELDAPRVIHADYTLNTLLEFWSGTRDDPDGVVRQVGDFTAPTSIPIYYDPRPQYSPQDVMLALINEVRRLRAETKPPSCTGEQGGGSE